MEVHENQNHESGALQFEDLKFSSRSSSRANASLVEDTGVILGFDDEALAIIERLTASERRRRLDVVSIVGMAGLGKTTLAKKVYNNALIVYHFYVQAWVYVSQSYRVGDLLSGILDSIRTPTNSIDQFHPETSDEKLGKQVYRRLKGKRYLIVLNDVWSIKAWTDMRQYFPNDNNGSKIMLISRITDVTLHAKSSYGSPHFLRFLIGAESWDLLRLRLFPIPGENCPRELMEIGAKIAERCLGLPLAIVVIAGVLTKTKTEDSWKRIATSFSSYIASDPGSYMHILALSYNYLPRHLKLCFLYLGAFPSDYEITAQRLIWLWVAKGWVYLPVVGGGGGGGETLEEVADEHLIDLVDINLVLVSKRRPDGGIKSCCVHDLMSDLCLTKAKEVKFMNHIQRYEQILFFPFSSSITTPPQARLSVHLHRFDQFLVAYVQMNPSPSLNRTTLAYTNSFLCFGHDSRSSRGDMPLIQAFKFLQVLTLSPSLTCFPSKITQLVHLKYLALQLPPNWFRSFWLPSQISNLKNLQTLIIERPSTEFYVPKGVFKMEKLRHLYVKRHFKLDFDGENNPICAIVGYTKPSSTCHYSLLSDLQTLTTLYLDPSTHEALPWMPNIKKLGCVFPPSSTYPNLDFLLRLEKLKAFYASSISDPAKLPSWYKFLSSLIKLTLSNFFLPWSGIQLVESLPNFQILKLLRNAFSGTTWNTNDGEFRVLEFLKLQDLDLVKWTCSSEHFPRLRAIVVDNCRKLEAVPPGLADISTMEMIKLDWPNRKARTFARKIQEEQQNMGNDGLHIFLYPSHEDNFDI